MHKKLEREFFPFVIKPGRYTGGEQGQVSKDHAGRIFVTVAIPDLYDYHALDRELLECYAALNAHDSIVCERAFLPDIDAVQLLREHRLPLFTLETAAPVKEARLLFLFVDDPLRYPSCITLLELAGIPARKQERTDAHPLVIAATPSDANPNLLSAIADGFLYSTDKETITNLSNTIVNQKDAPKEQVLTAIEASVPSCTQGEKAVRVSDGLNPPVAQPLGPLIILARQRIELSLKPLLDQILERLDKAIRATGFDELSVIDTDAPDAVRKIISIARAIDTKQISLTVDPLPATSFTTNMVDAIKKKASDPPAISAIAGSERLRAIMGSDASDAHIINAARMLFEKGYSECQLNFSIGCAGEEDSDIVAIAELTRRIHETARVPSVKRTIAVHLSTFSADPHTQYQWDALQDASELEQKLALLKRNLKASGVLIKHEDFETAILRAAVRRIDTNAGDLLFSIAATGEPAHISELIEKWKTAFAQCGIELTSLSRPLPFSAKLPWNLVDVGVTAEELRLKRQTISVVSAAEPEKQRTDEPTTATPTEFGRGKKKVLVRNVAAPTKNQVRLRWGKDARTRFMSHLDNMRLLERCLRKASIPVAYSNAKRPTMKLSHCHPLPLGFTSEYELLEITLDTNWMPQMIEQLTAAMPDGFFVLESRIAYGQAKSLSAAINRVTYTLTLDDQTFMDGLAERIGTLNGMDRIIIQREGKSETTEVDIRPALFDLSISGNELSMTLGLGERGYARPTEVFSLLDSEGTIPTAALAFHRKELFAVDDTNARISGMDV